MGSHDDGCTHTTYHEGVALRRVDAYLVDARQGLGVVTVGLNDSHVVIINGEVEVGVARHRDKSETVPVNEVVSVCWNGGYNDACLFVGSTSMTVSGRSEPSGRPKLLIRVVLGGLSWTSAPVRMR